MRASVGIASAVLVASGIATATARPDRSATPDGRHAVAVSAKVNCGKAPTLALVRTFVSAFNRGDRRVLSRVIAPASEFSWYAVNGAPGERIQDAAKDQRSLIGYFTARHGQSERLTLKSLSFVGYSLGKDQFTFTVMRTAADFDLPTVYGGKGAVNCWGHGGISVWAMGPATTGYSVPDALRRPLHLPTLGPGGACPVTPGQRFDNGQFGGVTLGPGPVQPLVAPVTGAERVLQGIVPVGRYASQPGWLEVKTLWFASPDYAGPIYIRGRQLDGPHQPVFGEGTPRSLEFQIGPGATINGTDGWREWPGATWLRATGCYAWQIDGTDFSHVIVFQATL